MIAKISSGGDFRGALDYLMNPKREERERAREKERGEQKPEKGREAAAEHEPQTETKSPREPNRERGVQKYTSQDVERETNLARTPKREGGREVERDLSDEYEPGQRHRIIGGNMSGSGPRELAREFALVEELRPDIEKPVHHVSISAGERDRLSVRQWHEIADTYIEKMGFRNCPYIVIQHRGTERDHIHILTSRIDFDGKVVSEWRSKQRAEEVMREVERKYDLERIQSSREVARAAPTRAEKEMFERTGKLSTKMSLQGHVERVLKERPSVTEFIEKLERVGVEVIPKLQETGRVSGISFRQGDELMKGSDLGRGFSWSALQKRGLDYDQVRDRPAIEAAKDRAEFTRETEPAVERTAIEPTHDFVNVMSDVERAANHHPLDEMNPFSLTHDSLYQSKQLGPNVTEVPDVVKTLLPERDVVERLYEAADLANHTDKDVVERLHEAARLEPIRDSPEALERLNDAAGAERRKPPYDPLHSPDASQELPHGTPAPLERTVESSVEREAVEQTIEMGIELLL